MTTRTTYTIACLSGHGIAPEVMAEASRALAKVSALHGFRIRETHPDTPVVLTSPGPALGWEETSGVHGVTILEGQPTGVRLDEAIRAALATPIPAL